MQTEDESLPKRKRVTQACESCRTLKSKCDGKRPICSRCRGYGYVCKWRVTRKHGFAVSNLQSSPSEPRQDNVLRQDLYKSQQLLRSLRNKLEGEDRRVVDSVLLTAAAIDQSSPAVRSPLSERSQSELPASHPFRRLSKSSDRYLGQVSDVWFFNSVRDVLRCGIPNPVRSPQLESYERDAVDMSQTHEETSFYFPDKETADEYVNIYFSTIHAAYPFVCRQQFMQDYQTYWDRGDSYIESLIFDPLLLTILAIGSYYRDCALPTEQSVTAEHSAYFRRAILMAVELDTEPSVANVGLLLAQCFYLLATCQTDRTWTTLGLAIRTAQSIGLHVEECQVPSPKMGIISQEFRRRTWFSLYVLDRLLSLQLGRPSAIRRKDCNTRLPSRLDDSEFDLVFDHIPDSNASESKPGDYFIELIQFSGIIGRVMRDIYRPSMIDYTEDMLAKTDRLDAELLDWRNGLPRWLRFDRGHTFEQSTLLRRQRNMLGIKFHHLRALIHRPYLCLPWLQRNDNNIKRLLEHSSHRVVRSERICVQEAQETAHMLHSVTDKKSLIEDFPWWQMISCLICASSILLVMGAFMSSSPAEEGDKREVLEEDANTCLKVFDALSTNSEAARLARDMLQNLSETRVQYQTTSGDVNLMNISPGASLSGDAQSKETSSHLLGQRSTTHFPATRAEVPQTEPAMANHPVSAWSWPSEMADSMTWSFQFVDTVDPAVLDSSSI